MGTQSFKSMQKCLNQFFLDVIYHFITENRLLNVTDLPVCFFPRSIIQSEQVVIIQNIFIFTL